jgi:elongation factor Ts
MATITADLVKQLRERTGAGMMECKKALVETARRHRHRGRADAQAGASPRPTRRRRAWPPRASSRSRRRPTASAAMVEVNCETDFVARESDFQAFADRGRAQGAGERVSDVAVLASASLGSGETVDERRRALVAKIGENISVRRCVFLESPGQLGAYRHGTRIGALVARRGRRRRRRWRTTWRCTWPRRIRSTSPRRRACRRDGQGTRDRDREGQGRGQAGRDRREDGRGPVAQVPRRDHAARPALRQGSRPDRRETAEGRQGLRARFQRFEVGAGIEKKQDDFVGEVMAQVKASGPAAAEPNERRPVLPENPAPAGFSSSGAADTLGTSGRAPGGRSGVARPPGRADSLGFGVHS